MRRSVMLIALCTSSVFACARGAPKPDPAAASAASAAPVAKRGAAASPKVGDRARCPVSGEEFVVTDSSPKAEYDGKTYYFCCPPCADRFKANPQKYVN